ncbi:helix-turn-helix domain-containing protein [Nocardia sp. NPDC048505]|uniref:PucR family transcriptional regulator n=1 Tax=unclassified Nocardia TaxID=2637762 RepID=UPI0033DFAF67
MTNSVQSRRAPETDPDDPAAEVVRACMDLALQGHRGADVAERIAELEQIARRWAQLGLGLDRLQQAVHQGYRLGSDSAYALDTPTDVAAGIVAARRQLDILESVHVRLTRAYTRQLPAPTTFHHAATRNLAVALLRGELAGPLARHCGIPISAHYHVIAVGIAGLQTRDAATPMLASRLESALTARCGETALAILGAAGGTLLLPQELVEDHALAQVIRELSRICPLTAVVVDADPAGIPAAGRQAHELLDTAMSLRIDPGLYRMGDLGLHFQLTRPGPARDALNALLTPLDGYPELLQTLSLHLANDLNRQRTASQLHVHTNTVDYRLKRIHQLTGCDPATPADLWRLRSSLIVRHYIERSHLVAR